MTLNRSTKITAATDVGRVREHNEDSYTINPNRMCFAVADGVAGAPHGEVASALATRCVYMASTTPHLTAKQVVKLAFKLTAERMAKEETTRFYGMMTTLAVLCIDVDKRKAVYGHVGDSRIYTRHRLNKILLTKDHQDSQGRLTHVMGTSVSHMPTIGEMTTFSDDVFVLCTDGVSNELSDDQILRYGSQFTANTVVRRAVMAGGRDNATAVVVKLL